MTVMSYCFFFFAVSDAPAAAPGMSPYLSHFDDSCLNLNTLCHLQIFGFDVCIEFSSKFENRVINA
jgi:hypothetical protein